ncbi:MAG: hypothetical protein JNL82_17445 [Myxococcales bacterium]|nr:hypothetical protein [Myxococcales bacterium]
MFGDGRVLDEKKGVLAVDLVRLILELGTRHGANARILVDGADFDAQAAARIAAELTLQTPQAEPPQAAPSVPTPLAIQQVETPQAVHPPPMPPRASRAVVTEGNSVALVELTHLMLWDTYVRATQAQGWMLNQSAAFTTELLENNRRLAEQASELQKRYQASLAEIDFVAREKMMMDAEASTARYARFLVDKAREEAARERPARAPGEWVDEMIDGVTLALSILCGVRPPREPWDSN